MNATSPLSDTKGPWALDDLHVGLQFKSGRLLVDERQMIAFARQFDPQPFHLDEAVAQQSFFGSLVASGWFTASVSMRLLLEALPLAGGTIGLGGEHMQWPTPVKAGDELHLEGEVISIRSSRSHNDRAVMSVRFTTFNQDNQRVFASVANLLVLRR